jgi:hypothetical protein
MLIPTVPGHPPTANRRPARPHPTRHLRTAVLALGATLLTLAVLVAVKVGAHPDFRADSGTGLRRCLPQLAPADTSNRLPTMTGLAGCLARRQPMRHDPIELLTVAALAALTGVEIRYLTHHRHPQTRPAIPGP